MNSTAVHWLVEVSSTQYVNNSSVLDYMQCHTTQIIENLPSALLMSLL